MLRRGLRGHERAAGGGRGRQGSILGRTSERRRESSAAAASLKFETTSIPLQHWHSAAFTVIISDWLSSARAHAGKLSRGLSLCLTASIHPSAAVDISTVLSAPSGHQFESPSASRRWPIVRRAVN